MTGVETLARAKGITRVCHFTPSRNLQHIAAGKVGVLSTTALEGAERRCYNPTDLARLDKKKSHICCSIEYPNAWYFEKARQSEPMFPDWVVLLIRPSHLWQGGTLFCPRNAAADFGRHIMAGPEGFEVMYDQRIVGTRGTVYTRPATHLAPCPTDQQAEVLIADQIPCDDIIAIGVRSEDQAKTERTRLRTNGADPDLFRFVIAPTMFEKYVLSGAIRSGRRPSERFYVPSGSIAQIK